MTHTRPALDDPRIAHAVETLWGYHNLRHEPRPTDVGVGLGSHDLSVATTTAELYGRGMFPLIVFTGANSPTTARRFPRGEAVHYREHAVELGVPADAVLIDAAATNTGENITNTRELLAAAGRTPRTATLITRPYQQRRAYATCRKLWPDLEPICAATPLPLAEYVAGIGDEARVINMLVGDTQRIDVYAERGFAIPSPCPTTCERPCRSSSTRGTRSGSSDGRPRARAQGVRRALTWATELAIFPPMIRSIGCPWL